MKKKIILFVLVLLLIPNVGFSISQNQEIKKELPEINIDKNLSNAEKEENYIFTITKTLKKVLFREDKTKELKNENVKRFNIDFLETIRDKKENLIFEDYKINIQDYSKIMKNFLQKELNHAVYLNYNDLEAEMLKENNEWYVVGFNNITYNKEYYQEYLLAKEQLDLLFETLDLKNKTTLEKSEIIAKKVIEIYDYDETINYGRNFKKEDRYNQTIFGILLEDKKVVCSGYAFTYKYLLDKANIKSNMIQVEINNLNHIYNEVLIEEDKFYTDLSYADSSNELSKYINNKNKTFFEKRLIKDEY